MVLELRTKTENKKFIKELLISCGCQEEVILKRNPTIQNYLNNVRSAFKEVKLKIELNYCYFYSINVFFKVENILDKFELDLNLYEESYFEIQKYN